MKSIHILCLTLAALLIGACGDNGSDDCDNCQPVGWVCMQILDQQDQHMDCELSYNFGPDTQGYEDSAECQIEGQRLMLIHGRPDTYRINAQCGDLFGHVDVPLEEGDNGLFSSRLVGSLCYNAKDPIVMGPSRKTIQLSDWLGHSSHNRCQDWFDYEETYNTEVALIQLDCSNATGDCEPNDSGKYLVATGEYGIISQGWPNSLDLQALPENVEPGTVVNLLVTIRQLRKPEQELSIPIAIQGSVCGNGIVEPGELCEGTEVNSSCTFFGFNAGEVVCTNCQVDSSDCHDEPEPEE